MVDHDPELGGRVRQSELGLEVPELSWEGREGHSEGAVELALEAETEEEHPDRSVQHQEVLEDGSGLCGHRKHGVRRIGRTNGYDGIGWFEIDGLDIDGC